MGGPPDDSQERHRRAGVMLGRFLGQRVRTAGGVEVSAGPIPSEIYQLFLADTMTPVPDAPAAALERPDGITRGMRGGDAVAFVRWANSIGAGTPAVRLPLEAELGDLAAGGLLRTASADGGPFAVWTQPGKREAVPLLWLPPGAADPRVIDAAALRRCVNEDWDRSGPTLLALLLLFARTAIYLLEGHVDRKRSAGTVLGLVAQLGQAMALINAMDPGLELGYAEMVTRDMASSFTRVRAGDFDHGLAASLAHHQLVRAASSLDSALAVGRDLVIPFPDPGNGLLLGPSLATPVRAASMLTNKPDPFVRQFSTGFGITAGIGGPSGRITAAPDALPGALSQTTAKLRDYLMGRNKNELPRHAFQAWLITLAERLEEDASPVFARLESPTREKATAIRMMALCLAGAAYEEKHKRIGDMCRHLAAGVTLLEQRASGSLPATEVVLLAVK